jgi:multiple sugar transport system substrate-binding protein
MKRSHNSRTALLSLLVLSLFLSACEAFKPRSSALAEPATIVFALSNESIQANRESRDYYTKKIEAFKAVEPNITVELKTTSSMDIDVTEIGWYDLQDASSIILSQALELGPFIEKEKEFNRSDFYPGLIEAFTRDGKLLALPTGVNPFVLYYNQDLFDQNGLSYPTTDLTWDDFKTLAMQLRDPAAGIYGYTPMDDSYTDAVFFAFQHGARLLEGSQPQLNSIEAIQALEWYATLYTNNDSAPNAETRSKEFSDRGFYGAIASGKVAMWIADYSNLSRFSNNARISFKVGIASLPHDQTVFSVAQFQGLVISSKTKSPEAAWRFIRFLSSQSQPWAIPARKSVTESEQYAAEFGKDHAMMARSVVQSSQLITSFDMTLFQPVLEAYLTAVAQTVDGMIPASQSLNEAQQKVQP